MAVFKIESYVLYMYCASSRADPDKWGVALCTVDGQTYSVGDVTEPFTVQSTR
jgi:glutaminase